MVVLSTHGLSTERFNLVERTTVTHCPPFFWWWLDRWTTCFSINEALEMVDKLSAELYVHQGVLPNLSVGFKCENVFKEEFKPKSNSI